MKNQSIGLKMFMISDYMNYDLSHWKIQYV